MALIMPSRRRFLFMAPAIIAASNLMPGHSIAALLEPEMREFLYVFPYDPRRFHRDGDRRAWGRLPGHPAAPFYGDGAKGWVPLTAAEQKHYEATWWPKEGQRLAMAGRRWPPSPVPPPRFAR